MDLERFSNILLNVCNAELSAAGIDEPEIISNILFEPQIRKTNDPVSFDQMAEILYGDGKKFNPFIDVAFLKYCGGKAIFFVRESGFPRVEWEKTFEPAGFGPFRSIGPIIK